MKFTTEIKIPQLKFQIDPHKRLLMLGSCFTDNIGAKFKASKWRVDINPCGVLYNPASIALLIKTALNNTTLTAGDLQCNNSIWFSWLFDSHFSSTSPQKALEKMNTALGILRQSIAESGTMIVTFGTSWIYELASTQQVVSNCHRCPQTLFNRRRMTIDETTRLWHRLTADLHNINPNLNILFTVSPIRHFKDGAHQNTLSKATLHLSIDALIDNNKTDYFPAYELVVDELRDYRFYAADMLHPSETAIDHIWQQLRQAAFSTETNRFTDRAAQLTARQQHRPITDTDSPEAQTFAAQTERIAAEFAADYPWAAV